jgi:hypothetical protein
MTPKMQKVMAILSGETQKVRSPGRLAKGNVEGSANQTHQNNNMVLREEGPDPNRGNCLEKGDKSASRDSEMKLYYISTFKLRIFFQNPGLQDEKDFHAEQGKSLLVGNNTK